MIPNRDQAMNAALMAIAASFQTGKPGQCKWPPEPLEARARFILQELSKSQTREEFVTTLEERAEAVSLPVGVVIQLLLDAMQMPWVEQEHEACWGSLKAMFKQIRSAWKIMRDRKIKHDKRQRKALFELGLIGENGGFGTERVDHSYIASHYHALRLGAPNVMWEGKILSPHSHDCAVQVIEARYDIDWASLTKAWNRKKIQVDIKAKVFPIE